MTTNASTEARDALLPTISRNWWALALRGLAAILVGLLAFFLPGITLTVLILLFGAYALVDGIFAIVAAVRAERRDGRWWLLVVEGVLGVLAGIAAFVWPGLTALTLLYLVAGYAIATGILEIVGAIRLRREIEGEWALILAGALSVIFGVLLAALPGIGILSLLWLIGGYSVAFGILLIVLSFRARGEQRSDQTSERNPDQRSTRDPDDETRRDANYRRFTEGRDLIRASDSGPGDGARGGERARDGGESTQGVRGREVRDSDGQEIGTVEEVYVDRDGATTRFLLVGAAPGFDGGTPRWWSRRAGWIKASTPSWISPRARRNTRGCGKTLPKRGRRYDRDGRERVRAFLPGRRGPGRR